MSYPYTSALGNAHESGDCFAPTCGLCADEMDHHENCAYPLGYSCTCEACDGVDRERANEVTQ